MLLIVSYIFNIVVVLHRSETHVYLLSVQQMQLQLVCINFAWVLGCKFSHQSEFWSPHSSKKCFHWLAFHSLRYEFDKEQTAVSETSSSFSSSNPLFYIATVSIEYLPFIFDIFWHTLDEFKICSKHFYFEYLNVPIRTIIFYITFVNNIST